VIRERFKTPNTIAPAKNGQASSASSRSITTAATTAITLTIAGTRNHHRMPRTSQIRRDSTRVSTAPATRMAIAG